MRTGYPKAGSGQVVGLLGGSFDPAHNGHVHITLQAIKRFKLDRVWWLVSPGNPLKTEGPAPLDKRLQTARAVMEHPRVEITDVEARLGTRVTAHTLAKLQACYPGVRFVWLMGADNLAQFHKWQQWREIIQTVPVGVLARPGDRISARHSRAAEIFRFAKLKSRHSAILSARSAPCWCFVNVPMIEMSSSEIRARGDWVRGTDGV